MTDEEKIKDMICKKCLNHTANEDCTLDTGCREFSNLLKLAKWKDEQFLGLIMESLKSLTKEREKEESDLNL